MPANHRESNDTIEIGRDYYYGPMNPEYEPIRRSSTLRSDEWDYYDRRNSNRRVRYDDYNLNQVEYDGRPLDYQDNIYYDRWQDNPGPVGRSRVRSPSPPDTAIQIARLKDELEHLRRDERRGQHAEDASRLQLRKPRDDSDEYERRIIAERPKTTPSKPVHPVEHREASGVQNGAPHIPGLFQTVFDVNHPQDASVHLELPITDDYGTELEEFCRLQRLGNFAAAEEYFKQNLEPYLSNPYVFVQYGQMLLEKGDYLAFERLNAEAVFDKDDLGTQRPLERLVVVERDWSQQRVRPRPRFRSWSRPREREREVIIRSRSQSPVESGLQQRRARFEPDVRIIRHSRSRSRSRSIDRHRNRGYRDDESDRGQSPDRGPQLTVTRAETDFDELELLLQNWRLMKAICTVHTKGNYEDALAEAWSTIENFRFGAGIGSTEIQLVRLALQVCANIGRIAPENYHDGLRESARKWIEWPALFKELIVQGRIWDFKDLYVANVAAFSDPGEEHYFGTDKRKQSLFEDWLSEEGDESTSLALLDQLLEPGYLEPVEPKEIKSRAEAVIAHCPAAMRSRSFIRWILASVVEALEHQEKSADNLWLAFRTHVQGFPGIVWHSPGCFLPGIYVPRNAENPGWIPPELSVLVNEPIQLALNLAKDLKDYKAQVACLKLLIFQSPDPTQLLQELASLQKLVQGDNQSHLETMLSSYLLCKDRPSKEKLLEELQQTDDWRDGTELRHGLVYWSRDFIERALKRSLQGPKSTAKLRNPPEFYFGKELPREAEQFTWQHGEHVYHPHAIPQRTDRSYYRDDLAPPSRRPIQARGQQIIRSRSRPHSPSRRHFPLPEPRSQSPPDPRDDESYNRRERELELDRWELQLLKEERERHELEQARKELQRIKEMEEGKRREKQDAEVLLRLAEAEKLVQRQAEINKTQKEEMEKRAAEMKQLEQNLQSAQEKQEREARAQQDRETRERLERAESSLRDQAERLRRTEDREYQKWLAARVTRPREKTRWRRFRRRNSVTTSSDTYSSDSPPSSDDDDSSDDRRSRRTRRRDTVTSSSDEEDETTHERRVNRRRLRSGEVLELRDDSGKDEAEPHDGDDTAEPQQNTCTALVLWRGVQLPTTRDAYIAPSPLPRSPTADSQGWEDLSPPTNVLRAETPRRINESPHGSTKRSSSKEEADYRRPAASRNSVDEDDITIRVRDTGSVIIGDARMDVKDGEEITIHTIESQRNPRSGSENVQEEVNGNGQNAKSATSNETTTGAVHSRLPTVHPQRREEGDDLNDSVRRVVIEERPTPKMSRTRRSRETRADKDDLERQRERLKSRFERSASSEPSSVPRRRRDSYIEPLGPPRERPRSTLENTQIYTDGKTEHLTAEPQDVDHREDTGPGATKNVDENYGSPRPHRSESQNRDEFQQNERIANRPSRPASMARYASPRSSMHDTTGIWDAWEQSKGGPAPPRSNRRMVIDPSPSGANTSSRVSARTRSRPSSMQELDDVLPGMTRLSRGDYRPPTYPAERLQSPTKRQSLIIDADGRPQPIRTTSESRHSRPSDAESRAPIAPIIITRRGTSADGRRSMPPPPPPANIATGPRARPHSMNDVSATRPPHHSDPAPSSIPDKLPAESWERETEGVWRKKKAVSTVHEDPEEEGDEWGGWGVSKAEARRRKEGESSKEQASLEPEQGVSRKSTVTDPEPNEDSE